MTEPIAQEADPSSQDMQRLKKAVETLLFITDQPLGLKRISEILEEEDHDKVIGAVQELRREYEERGSAVQIVEIADGFQMASRSEYAPFVRRLYTERTTMRLSAAALETLSIIAYKQPITRAEIEEIRGVEVIAALETLLDKRLVRVVGRRETVGRPLLYGTTPEFLRLFGLKGLSELPPLEQFSVPPPAPAAAEPEASAATSASSAAAETTERSGGEPAVGDEPSSQG